MRTQTGTPYYASPEVWRDKPYNTKADIWSLGAIFYELATLRPPFVANDMQGLMRRIIRGVFQPLPSCFSRELQSFIASCLQVEPSARPSVDDLLASPELVRNAPAEGEEERHEQEEEAGALLNTIKVPQNLALLGLRLPKPNYESRPGSSYAEATRGHSLSFAEESEQGGQVRLPSIAAGAPHSVKHEKLEKLSRAGNRSSVAGEEGEERVRAPVPLPPYRARVSRKDVASRAGCRPNQKMLPVLHQRKYVSLDKSKSRAGV